MLFNRIAITGHTQGIGLALYNYYQNQGKEVIGFSLDNGWDISRDLTTIINQTEDCDLFFNHAYCDNYQTAIAQRWHVKHWRHNHWIVNTSSEVSLSEPIVSSQMPWLAKYQEHKQNLNVISRQINSSYSKCKSITLLLPHVDTNFMLIDIISGLTLDPASEQLTEQQIQYQKITRARALTVLDVMEKITWTLDSITDRSFCSSIQIESAK